MYIYCFCFRVFILLIYFETVSPQFALVITVQSRIDLNLRSSNFCLPRAYSPHSISYILIGIFISSQQEMGYSSVCRVLIQHTIGTWTVIQHCMDSQFLGYGSLGIEHSRPSLDTSIFETSLCLNRLVRQRFTPCWLGQKIIPLIK